MKNLCSYLAPIAGLGVLVLCDFAVFSVYIHPHEQLKLKIFLYLIVYNVLVFMAILSLLMTWCGNPGFIPKGYCYDSSKLSILTQALYKYVVKH